MWILFVGMAIVSLVYLAYGLINSMEYGMKQGWGYSLGSLSEVKHAVSDYEPVWQGNAYVLCGENPYKVMDGTTAFDPEIGPIVKGTANVPWTYGLSNIFIPGFLPYKGALAVSLLWWVVLWGMAVFLLLRRLREMGVDDFLLSGLLVLAMFCQNAIGVALETMNPACFVVPLLFIISFLDDKKYPYLLGCCLGLAMIKPQLAALFFIPFIVKKNFKAVLTGVGLCVLSLLAVSLRIGENPVALVEKAFLDGFENFEAFSGEMAEIVSASEGIFSALFGSDALGSDTLLHWLVFIPYTFLLCWKFRRAPFYILFSIPFVVSMLWMYNLPLNRNTGLLWMALMLMLYRTEEISCGRSILAYGMMLLVGFPFMSGTMARMIGTFKIWPITALLVFVALHIVLYWYWRDTERQQSVLKNNRVLSVE